MPPLQAKRRKGGPVHESGQEALYLRHLSEKQVPVQVKLRDGEVVRGWIEYFDDQMIRLTREGAPNLFIYKEQIRSISEFSRRDEGKRRVIARRAAATPGATAVPAPASVPTATPAHTATPAETSGD